MRCLLEDYDEYEPEIMLEDFDVEQYLGTKEELEEIIREWD